jgi:hypothetical protein
MIFMRAGNGDGEGVRLVEVGANGDPVVYLRGRGDLKAPAFATVRPNPSPPGRLAGASWE